MRHTSLEELKYKLDKKINSRSRKRTSRLKTSIDKQRSKTKVCFKWLSNKYTRKVKAYMAYLVDNDHSISSVSNADKHNKKYFDSRVYPVIKEKYPQAYPIVKKYYNSKEKKLTKKHYCQLLYARLVNMYEDGFQVKTTEHPLHSSNVKFRKDYRSF